MLNFMSAVNLAVIFSRLKLGLLRSVENSGKMGAV